MNLGQRCGGTLEIGSHHFMQLIVGFSLTSRIVVHPPTNPSRKTRNAWTSPAFRILHLIIIPVRFLSAPSATPNYYSPMSPSQSQKTWVMNKATSVWQSEGRESRWSNSVFEACTCTWMSPPDISPTPMLVVWAPEALDRFSEAGLLRVLCVPKAWSAVPGGCRCGWNLAVTLPTKLIYRF